MNNKFKNSILILFYILFFTRPVWADPRALDYRDPNAPPRVVIIERYELKDFEAIQKAKIGFESALECNVLQLYIHRKYDFFNEYIGDDTADVIQKTQKFNPDLILFIGPGILPKFKGVTTAPGIYLYESGERMILSWDQEKITGVNMFPSFKAQLSTLISIAPGVKNVGTIYSKKNIHFLEKAASAAEEANIRLFSENMKPTRSGPLFYRNIINNGRIEDILEDMEGIIDAFWILPDREVYADFKQLNVVVSYTLENKLPVITPFPHTGRAGALITIRGDPRVMGRQAAELAKQKLKSPINTIIKPVDLKKLEILINKTTADYFKIEIPEKVMNNPDVQLIYGGSAP